MLANRRYIMNDTELELSLREAAPQVAVPSSLGAHRTRLIADSKARRRRSAWSWTAGAGVTALLLGGGSAAMAANGITTPWGWAADNIFSIRTDAGECVAGYQVLPLEGQDPEAYEEARDFVATLDLTTLDESAITWWEDAFEDSADRATDQNGAPAPTVIPPTQLRQQAISAVIGDLTAEHLKSKGLAASYGAEVRFRGCDE